MEIITSWAQLTPERIAKGGYEISDELLEQVEAERDLEGPDGKMLDAAGLERLGIRSAVTGSDLSEVDY